MVCYKGGWISYQIGRRLVKVSFISLVNLILGRAAVTELIQDALTPDRLDAELQRLLTPVHREQMLAEYAELRRMLGDGGASHRAAEGMLAWLGR